MSRVWFAQDLETVGMFWRVLRTDGIALGYTNHDSDIWLDGILHRASPGMVPSSIKRSSDFEADSAEVQGALSHESISAQDLSDGRFDGAGVLIGMVDWETLETEVLYRGSIGTVGQQDASFTAELVSRKAELLRDPVPRTSPTCRAVFCGPGCDISPLFHTYEAVLTAIDESTNSITVDTSASLPDLAGGWVRWLDGPQAGVRMSVAAVSAGTLVLDIPVDPEVPGGTRLQLREGCDHTLDTCSARFANAANFRGEPFLPGNDMLTRYPSPAG